jgi:hypothetical protein
MARSNLEVKVEVRVNLASALWPIVWLIAVLAT